MTLPAFIGAEKFPGSDLKQLALRYGLSAFGPFAVSGAHFLAALIILHAFSRTAFGLFSFVLVVVPFCLSIGGALLCVSITSLVARDGRASDADIATHLNAALVVSAAATLAVLGLLKSVHATWDVAAIFGLYGGAMTLRWFARSYAYALNRPYRTVSSDFLYSILIVALLPALMALHELSMRHAALVLLAASGLGLAAFGPDYLKRQFLLVRAGSLAAYGPIWRDMTRWSLLGVVLTEMTANAHVYIVTLVSGPSAFALLAVGALLMRPVSLTYAALPDLERPAMARAIAAGDGAGALRIVKQFRTAVGAMWLLTVLAAGALLMWFPQLVLKKGYSIEQALIVLALFAVLMAVRGLRTPESVLLQANRAFRPLAKASLISSIVSLVMTLALLLVWGPIASLGGILAGEAVITANILRLSARWKHDHA